MAYELAAKVLEHNARHVEQQIRISDRALEDVERQIADDKAKGRKENPDLIRTRDLARETRGRNAELKDELTRAAHLLTVEPAPAEDPAAGPGKRP